MTRAQDLRDCRARLAVRTAERDEAQRLLLNCQAESAHQGTVITSLEEQAAAQSGIIEQRDATIADMTAQAEFRDATIAIQGQNIADLNELLDEATAEIHRLEAIIADLEGGGDPTEEVLRDTDGTTIQAALNEMTGDVLRLVGEFAPAPEIHFPRDGMTLRCLPGEARILGNGTSADVIGVKEGPGKGKRNITLENLEVDSRGSKNGVVGWFGLRMLAVKTWGAGMTGFHVYTEGSPEDAQIELVDCDLSDNGSEEELGHGAAGSKVFMTHGVTYLRTKANDCIGNGFWSDHNCGRVEYIDTEALRNRRRAWFREKCGRHGDPYPKAFVYGMYVADFIRLGGRVIYDAPLVIQGGVAQENGAEGALIVASPHARVSGATFGGNAGGDGLVVRNDPNRMYPNCAGKTEPGWMVEDIALEESSFAMNGDRVVVSGNVPTGMVVRT